MRKLSMARAGKGGGGSKKVSPPSVPGAPILYTGHQNASVNFFFFFICKVPGVDIFSRNEKVVKKTLIPLLYNTYLIMRLSKSSFYTNIFFL